MARVSHKIISNVIAVVGYNIFIDFYKLPIDCNKYDIIIIIVNRFSKRLFLIPYYKNINIEKAA